MKELVRPNFLEKVRRARRLAAAVALQALGIAGVAAGQSVAESATVRNNQPQAAHQPAYGISGESIYSIDGSAFVPNDSSTPYTRNGAENRWLTGPGFWTASVTLPTGATVTGLDVLGCDDSDTGQLAAGLFYNLPVGYQQPANLVVAVGTGAGQMPGCSVFSASTSNGAILNDIVPSYFVKVDQGGATDGSVRLLAVHLRYKLQISPAPGTATFADVPVGHPQFRFVEALVSAGITAGCGNGMYCPTQPVTRGQMAVFLSVALGLYFPN